MRLLREKDFWKWYNETRSYKGLKVFVHGQHREPTAHIPRTGRYYRVIVRPGKPKLFLKAREVEPTQRLDL